MQCVEFLEYSARWMEGERDASAAAHLKSCGHCSALVADLKFISGSARQLSEAEPPARVWVSLRNQLEVEGLIREAAGTAVVPAAPRPRVFLGLRPALATGLAAVVLLLGGLMAFQGGMNPQTPEETAAVAVAPADGSEVMAELAQFASLAKASAPEMHEHNPVVTAAFKENLQVVDNAIAMCEKTVKQQPRNDVARELLLSAYRQKAELLASMSQRGALGD